MATGDFQLNAAGVMANQPSDIRYQPATPAMMELSGGGVHAVNRTDGDRIIVTWGEDAAKDGALAEVIADLAGTTACRVRWEDPAGTTYDVNCQAEAVGHRMSARGDLFLPFTVTFFERPS